MSSAKRGIKGSRKMEHLFLSTDVNRPMREAVGAKLVVRRNTKVVSVVEKYPA
jgi:hypothetical protein